MENKTQRKIPAQMSKMDKMVRMKVPCSTGWQLLHKRGDLFTCPPTSALAHCISEDCRMGAGIAVLFKKKFRGVEELQAQKKQPGQCAVLERSGRFVYYLITKRKYNQKPTYDNLKKSLVSMREHCLANGVNSISMPRIGCGLDKLKWENVSSIITEVFQDTKISITVYTIYTTTVTEFMENKTQRKIPAQMSKMDKMVQMKVPCSTGWQLLHKRGDLFTCPPTSALAHCISEDCRMGAGIAVLFKKKFRGVEELQAQKKQPGQCAVLERSGRFVYYLITKRKYNQKPTYDNLKKSLVSMREHCLANGVNSISMPRIGCGLDKLKWENVSSIITEVFQDTKISITVYTIYTTTGLKRIIS